MSIVLILGYKYELSLVLNGTTPIPDLTALELHLAASLNSSRHVKTTKDYFNYLLLDPRVLNSSQQPDAQLKEFRKFVEGVFYVGKGKNARSMQHLKEAKEELTKNVQVRNFIY